MADDDESTKSLLGMIRELVQVTSEWGDSIVLEDRFRAMVEDAGNADGSSASASDHESDSSKIDFGLLGLDRFKDTEGNPYLGYRMNGDSAPDLSTFHLFWEEEGGT